MVLSVLELLNETAWIPGLQALERFFRTIFGGKRADEEQGLLLPLDQEGRLALLLQALQFSLGIVIERIADDLNGELTRAGT